MHRTEEILKEINELYKKIGISIEMAKGYLAGIIDGEGSVYCNGKKAYVSVGSTDTDIIFRIIECLDVLGVRYSIYRNQIKSGKEFYNISIPRRQVEKLIELPYGCERKIEKMKKVVEETRAIEYKKAYISEEEWKLIKEENISEWAKRNKVHEETAKRWKNERNRIH